MDDSLKESQIICLKAIANGDRRAFERLYRSTSAGLFAIALRMLRNRQWAEEVLVDVFLTVWQRAGDYDPSLSSPMTWLTHLIRNRCIDGLRSRYGRYVGREEEYSDQIPQLENEGLDEDGEQAKKLNDCLKHLTSEQRQSIVLAYYQGMSHADIADWLQQPLGTVKSWVRRALAHLKDCVGL
ncbi:sigma-70 family RNA polymerase sigma factor [Serratia marcescens]|uniref:sigma-70 family RNA polymerase sigma factor n=1 Tax=Serratia marcescens TaxID=615 RepID=UPI0011E611EE|nr:sigma-70 family RNA polymerase sigma factor [Serratia marcescens]